ncbi:MAG: class I SAM-dependent methyltransferase [bacterium]
MPKIAPFDQYPNEYDRWFEDHRWAYLSELAAVRHFIPAGKRGIEIGIGTGRFALPLGIREGVEPSPVMRSISKRNGLLVFNGTAEKLPLTDHSYDFALMVTTVCFVDDVTESFNEVNRILGPGGRFIVGLVDKKSALGAEYQRKQQSNRFYRVANFYSTDEVIAYLFNTAFGDIEVVQTVFGDLRSIREVQAFKEGYGEGGFVVIKASPRPRERP